MKSAIITGSENGEMRTVKHQFICGHMPADDLLADHQAALACGLESEIIAEEELCVTGDRSRLVAWMCYCGWPRECVSHIRPLKALH